MLENISDLLKLKDTLEIVPDDPYQDVYDEVSADLALKEFNMLELFHHCVETCHKIFKLSEFRYGKAAKNISTNFLDDIATLYRKNFVNVQEMKIRKKRDTPTLPHAKTFLTTNFLLLIYRL